MYIGGGEMIEAPYTGATVHITGLRLSGGFVGAGRP
jgi:cell wall-associated NlpC family hydrolase